MVLKTFKNSRWNKLGQGVLFGSALAWGIARADTPQLQPGWVVGASADNNSYLGDLHYRPASPFDDLMANKTIEDLKQRYGDLNRDYELKKSYSLVGQADEQQHMDDLHSFARQVVSAVRSYQTQKQVKQIQANADQDPGLEPFKKPGGIVAGSAAILTGTPVKLKIDDQTRFESRTDARNQTGNFALTSNFVNTSLNVDMSHNTDPNASAPERAHFSMSRGLPIWNLSTSVGYGVTAACVSASLSKPILPHLGASIESTRPMQMNGTDPEESVHLTYGLQF